ncbi:hypothetical protein AB0C34_24005 [Nocardia sp. NPDC049220]|uniref:hypothetical protein n=1 Tax=Nocardia sp. NPDC049220 TaxID=3155273 RepID=UPI0033C3B595
MYKDVQQQEPVSSPSGRLRLDPAAVAVYTTVMDRVADQLGSASAGVSAESAVIANTAELGEVGADFAADFGRILDTHAAEWAFGGRLVSEYNQSMHSFAATASAVDDDLAAAIRRGGGAQ